MPVVGAIPNEDVRRDLKTSEAEALAEEVAVVAGVREGRGSGEGPLLASERVPRAEPVCVVSTVDLRRRS